MPDTLIKFKTGDLSKMDNGATDEVGINNGTVYFATDDTTKNGKIYFDSPEGDRIDMTAYAKESDYATLANNIDGTVSVAHGGTGATDAAAARTNLAITPVNIGAATSTHTHGNITNDGKVGTAANKAVYTTTGGAVTAGTLPVAAGGTGASNLANITVGKATADASGNTITTTYAKKSELPTDYVQYVTQTLTAAQKEQARANIGIKNLVDGSATGSLRSINSTKEDSSYTIGKNSISIGSSTKVTGIDSQAFGYDTLASSDAAHAEGYETTASGLAAHAEGYGTTASKRTAHAEGFGTTASEADSHAEGNGTTSSGSAAHAEGFTATASGDYSHAEGNSTIAKNKSQHVFGEFNIEDPSTASFMQRGNYVEIVGNGTSNSAKSNARTLDWNGNEILAGKLTIGTGPTNNMDVATKQYVDNAFSVNDAMVFKGVLDSPSNIPDTHQAGWTYRIGTTGTYAGQICEVGDLLICVADGTEASNNDWNVVQNNLDGALFKGNNTFTDGQVLIADGVTGKTKTSGFTIAKSVPSDAKFTDTTYTFDGTYNASTNKAATVSTVTNAINALDGNLNSTTPGAAKTLTAFSQTNGKISATFGNISITKSQISDFPTSLTPTSHTHGNITNDGTLPTASRAVVTDANKKITVADMTVASPTAATTTSTTFIDTVSQASNGKISATKKTLPTASTSTAGIIQIGTGSDNAAAGNHTHTMSLATDTGTSSITLASAGKYKLTAGGSSIIFTMPTSNNYSHPTGDGNLHVPANGTTNNGKFLQATATAGSYQWASLSSSDITAALGFTPYNSTNPNGYTSNTGTITGVTGSDGLTGSGTSGSVTIKHAAPSTSPATTTSAIYPITIDKYGHITAKGSAITPLTASSTLDASKLSGTIPASCYTNTTYGAEKGISLSSGKFGHSNTAITAQTTQAVYPIKIDAYGHITGYGSAVTSMPASDVSAWAKAASKPTYTATEVGALPDDTTIADHSITTPTGGTSRTTDVTLNTATVLSSVKSAGTVPTLGTAIPADDIMAWITNTPTAVIKKTVVTSASGATAAYANGILTITDGSFGTGDSVSVIAGTAAYLSYAAKSIPNVTAVGSMPTFNTTTVATSVKTQPAFSVTTTTTELSHTIN